MTADFQCFTDVKKNNPVITLTFGTARSSAKITIYVIATH